MDTTQSLTSLSPSHRQANTRTHCLYVTGRCRTPGSWVTYQCARDAHGGTAVNSCQYSECHCCPACLPLLLLLAKHKYLFISYAKTIGVGSRGDAGLLCGRWGCMGQRGFLASLLATMHKFVINYHSEFYYQQSQLNYCVRRRGPKRKVTGFVTQTSFRKLWFKGHCWHYKRGGEEATR